jgi:hypothetical protein
MDLVDLRETGAALRQRVRALNTAHEAETSPLNAARLDAMLAACCAAPARADGRAFLIAFAEGAAYDSPNYGWVAARHPRFVYVDRIVVAPDLRGSGVGRALYETVFAQARARAAPVLCEVNLRPPNPVSDAFRAALGFTEAGRARLAPGKEVRYLIRREE